jgi:hypothetical protein
MFKQIVALLLKYFKVMHPLRMLWHLLWLTLVLMVCSLSYILTFHFEPVMDLYQRSRSFEHFQNELTTSMAIDTQINEELSILLRVTNSERVYVFRYHNGIPAVAGIPFIFHTNTHEVIKPGVNRVIGLMQRIPSSINVHMNQEFAARKCVILQDIDLDSTGTDYWFFQSRGARHMIRCAFYSRQGDLLGFVGVDYLSSDQREHLHRHHDIIRETAIRIGIILQQRA